MTESLLLILGNQLFPEEIVAATGCKTLFMAEDAGLCTYYKHHKHKLILFLTAMRRYRDEKRVLGYNVLYKDFEDPLFEESYEHKLRETLRAHPRIKRIVVFEIEDRFFEKRLRAFCEENEIKLKVLETPLFLVSREEFRDYNKKSKKPFMKTFYEQQRKKFKILLEEDGKPTGGSWSYDKLNRKKLPKTIEFNPILSIEKDALLKEVSAFVKRRFADHPGEVENFWWPTDRHSSLQWLDHFIDKNLPLFGDYQDAITHRSDFLFHALIAPMLNMGLLLPSEVVDRVEKAFLADPEHCKINAVEGFIRQVLGWREFVRGIYQEYGEQQWTSNFWKSEGKLTAAWYEGTTGIPVLDDAILKARKYAYGHHIERLMILSNMMLLSEIHPHEVYRWFMEMFADSSDWVMGPNVFGMGQFSDGGVFATKPYICGSNYYLKMGDYKKGDWCETVDGLYWRFVDKNIDFFSKNPRTPFVAKNLKRMDGDRKQRIFSRAEDFIREMTVTPS